MMKRLLLLTLKDVLFKLFIGFLIIQGGNMQATGKNTRTRPPKPLLPIPTARQLAWQQAELALFLHFGVNTFTNREWGDGTENPQIFNPTRLDAGQWVEVALETGFKTIILTAKHHDGFCLWPSSYTEHSVKNSPWQQGGGDVVRQLADACAAAGLKMGLYLSPWDRHEPTYGNSPAYNLFYLAQLRELLTNYGPLAEVWFDGACGEGPNGKKQVYDFQAYWALVRQLQPQAVIFSDEGPDVRWIGNEHGFAGETCWSLLDRTKVTVGHSDTKYLNAGDINGPDWVPGECDVSIRKGWFWHPEQQPKSVPELVDIYFKSVGRNGVLLLNVPPDTTGRLAAADVAQLKAFKAAIDHIFETDLAKGKTVHTDAVRGKAAEFVPQNMLDHNPGTYWAPDDTALQAAIEIELGQPTTFNVARLQEPITFGQRIQAYRLEYWADQQWHPIVSGTTIGYKKLDRFTAVTARRVRLVIEKARACPLINEFGLYFDDGAWRN